MIKRYAPKVYYAYDGDEAGQKAMLRGIDILREQEIEPRVIVIPEGRDPDEFIKAYGADSFYSLKDASITGTRFKLERLAKLSGVDSADGRESFAREACSLLSGLEPVERERYVPFVAETAGLSADAVREQCGIAVRTSVNNTPRRRYNNYKKPRNYTEKGKSEQKLLACIMTSPENGLEISRSARFSPELFSSPALRAFCMRLLAGYRSGSSVKIPLMLAELEGEAAEDVSSAFASLDDLSEPVMIAEDIMASLALSGLKEELAELSAKVNGATGAQKTALMKEYLEKYTELQKLSK